MAERLEGAARAALLADLAAAGWEEVAGRDAIRKSFRFDSFAEAWGWMTRIAIHAERMNHHPEWSNVYSRVEVVLTTHDAGGVTEKDIALARRMEG